MSRTVKIITHLGAVGIGIGIAIATSSTGVSTRSSLAPAARLETEKIPTPQNHKTASDITKQDSLTRKANKSGDFKAAWDSFLTRDLPREERMRMHIELLEKWAQVDLQAALDAATNQTWNETHSDPFASDPLSAFSKVFSERPLEAWALIQSGRYGMAANPLRMHWLLSNQRDSDLILSLLPEMTEKNSFSAIYLTVRNQKPGPELDAMLEKIAALAGDDHKDWLRAAASGMPTRSGGDLSAPPSETWAEIPVGAGSEFAILKWGATMHDRDAGQASAELATLPSEARETAAEAMITQFRVNCLGLLPILDFAVTTNSWDSLSKENLNNIVNRLSNPGQFLAEETAGWAASLPQRKNTAEIYQAAVTRYIDDDLPRAREWLGTMEKGSWQRDNALAVYARQAIANHDDREPYQWAQDSITDPKIKAQVTQWKREREQQERDSSYQGY